MEKQIETCPWCHREVQVESGRERLYQCPFCKKEFTFTPSAAEVGAKPPAQRSGVRTALPSDFVETPFVKDLVARTLVYLQDGLHVHLSGPAGAARPPSPFT